jgi:hypothetical protein
MAWYLKGFRVPHTVREPLGKVTSLFELDALLAQINPDQDFNSDVGTGPRGRTSGERRPALPDGWLETCDLTESDRVNVSVAEFSVSGG